MGRQLFVPVLAIIILLGLSIDHGGCLQEKKVSSPEGSGQILIKFKPEVSKAQVDSLTKKIGLEKVKDFPGISVSLYRIISEITVEETLQKCRDSSIIEYAEPNYIYHMDEVPNDPRFKELWGMYNTGQTGGRRDADIDVPEAWTYRRVVQTCLSS